MNVESVVYSSYCLGNFGFIQPSFVATFRKMDATNSNTGVASSYLPGRNVNGHVSNQGPTDPNILTSHFSGMNIGGMNMHGNAGPMPIATAPGFIVGSEGQFVYASMAPSQPMNFNPTHDGHYHNFHMAPGSYGAPYVGLPMPLMPFTPGRNHIPQHRLDRGHSEVPSLENRRGSYSTTESTPATPFYGAMSHREIAPRVASLDRSAYTTPSPQQIVLANAQIDQHGKSSALTRVSDQALDDMLKKSPSIPKAVPAVFTPASQMKSVEQSLENRIPGNRNVYIRGLHPTTDDELLFKFASRFGEVETSKAIIDTGTGACKGYEESRSWNGSPLTLRRFGFAKFYNIHDSELCIRGFHRLGYEVGFARVSRNTFLKYTPLAHPLDNRNLSTRASRPKVTMRPPIYIFPIFQRLCLKLYDAFQTSYASLNGLTLLQELGTIFLGYTILSSKILRDSMGNSRGVGFARCVFHLYLSSKITANFGCR